MSFLGSVTVAGTCLVAKEYARGGSGSLFWTQALAAAPAVGLRDLRAFADALGTTRKAKRGCPRSCRIVCQGTRAEVCSDM